MAAVRLQFVGSGDAFASGGRFNTCLHLLGGEEPMLIDCGASSLVALKQAGVDPAGIGWIALTHLHGDHFGGIPFMVLDGQFSGRTKPLVIAGPPGTEERLNRTFEAMYPGSSGIDRAFDTSIVVLDANVTSPLGPAGVTPFEVRHPSGAPAYALRVQYGGKVITYSGDTEWTENLIAASQDADLFVCECNFFGKDAPNHVNYETLIANRSRLTCRRLLITHMGEEMLSHVGDTDLEPASDGMVVVV
jgi:ribonuclease BN (tRNA processing enzyme)